MTAIGENIRAKSSDMSGLKRVVLLGELGRKFGRVHNFAVRNPAEAVRALCANFPEFKSALTVAAEKNVGHKVIVGRAPVCGDEDLHHPAGRQVIKIVPVIAGSGGAIGKIFLGVALIAASFLVPGIGLVGALTLGGLLGNVGIALALGGVAQLLSPQPKSEEPPEDPDNKPSYVFNGPVNTTVQGHPVPVGYGRLIVGSCVISVALDSEQLLSTVGNVT